jgi:hypothetical protein
MDVVSIPPEYLCQYFNRTGSFFEWTVPNEFGAPPKKWTVLPFENGCLPFFELNRSYSRKGTLPISIRSSLYHQWTNPIPNRLQL